MTAVGRKATNQKESASGRKQTLLSEYTRQILTSANGQKRTLTKLILQSLMFTRRFRVDFIDEFIE